MSDVASTTDPNPSQSGSTPPNALAQPGAWSGAGSTLKSVVVGAVGLAATAAGLVAQGAPSPTPSMDIINNCGMAGNAKPNTWQARANPLKSRYNMPSGEDINADVTIDALVAAKNGSDAGNPPFDSTHLAQTTSTFTPANNPSAGASTVTFSEGQSAEVTGYIAQVKEGGNESCNCNTNDEQYMDTHIYLSAQPGTTDKSQCIIVEVTPRIRQMKLPGADWSTPTLMSQLKVGTKVQVSGWLFDDWEHRANSKADGGTGNVWRASCWEIHPVTDIQVLAPPGAAK